MAERFARAVREAAVPAVYRDFILSGAYLPYRRAFVHGLQHYGPRAVELRLDSPRLLTPARLFEAAGIEDEQAAGYHPVAVIPGSAQVLVIDVTDARAPVFLLHHETGVFHRQFATFADFVAALRSPDQVRRERAAVRRLFADIRKVCGPAAARARDAIDAGRLDEAQTLLDRVLATRRPVTYDGSNDFVAIGMLCEIFDLRGRISVRRGDLRRAHTDFLDAVACGGRPYWQAAVDLAVVSFLLGEPGSARQRLEIVERADFTEPPAVLARRTFSEDELDVSLRRARAIPADDPNHAFAAQVLDWFDTPRAVAPSDGRPQA